MRSLRLIRSTALGVAILALAAPAALADIHEEAVVGSQPAAVVSPIRDETVVASTPAVVPIRDETVVRAATISSHPVARPSDGIDWEAAIVGAAVTLAILALAAGGAAALRRRGSSHPAGIIPAG